MESEKRNFKLKILFKISEMDVDLKIRLNSKIVFSGSPSSLKNISWKRFCEKVSKLTMEDSCQSLFLKDPETMEPDQVIFDVTRPNKDQDQRWRLMKEEYELMDSISSSGKIVVVTCEQGKTYFFPSRNRGWFHVVRCD
jgi:hypothetical protein